ncbi:MBL fold metallo-hydrolase [Bacillus infantis]|uniref:MBL fold metallo-hydrolase n=1 Tax=Bacillus infantis TaxID=324767 RepID=UPI002FBE1C26
MKVDILSSGSKGNVIALRSSETAILVDAGIPKTQIEKHLLEAGIRPNSIKAIFVTHAHGDHTKGLPIANKYKIPVYAGEGEWKLIKGVNEELQRIIRAGSAITFKEYFIEAFRTHHDSHDPLGYTISDFKGHKCSICLDTGHVDSEMIAAMEYAHTYILEANHEPRLVEISKYPAGTKARILSNNGHLSNEQAAEALAKLINGLGEQIFLVHLSHENNRTSLAKATVQKALFKKGFKPNQHYRIEVV